jgi:hypothetical protein
MSAHVHEIGEPCGQGAQDLVHYRRPDTPTTLEPTPPEGNDDEREQV